MASDVHQPPKVRARDLGIPFEGLPGPFNAITDVASVEVGHATIIEGEAIRTGVTAIWPRGRQSSDPVFGGWFSLNGNGEMTGTAWVEESGFIDGPILTTNTHSVGLVRDTYIRWQVANGRKSATNNRLNGGFWSLPIVAETYDGFLNNINGFHVREPHVVQALETARSGAIPEGNVGGGTGTVCYELKGGIGTASRVVKVLRKTYCVGVLAQCNCGRRDQLRIVGVPVGLEIPDLKLIDCGASRSPDENGSIIIVVATDAPLLPHQTKRIARRAGLGLARTGSVAANGSGDIFVAFSIGNVRAAGTKRTARLMMLPNEWLSALFEATVQATEEAIVNALIAAETMSGMNGRRVHSLPKERVQAAMQKYNRNQTVAAPTQIAS